VVFIYSVPIVLATHAGGVSLIDNTFLPDPL
jgi:hypothetical protein